MLLLCFLGIDLRSVPALVFCFLTACTCSCAALRPLVATLRECLPFALPCGALPCGALPKSGEDRTFDIHKPRTV